MGKIKEKSGSVWDTVEDFIDDPIATITGKNKKKEKKDKGGNSGLYVGGDFECIREIINMGAIVEGNIRFFVGYSGWEKGQLRKELDNFEWAVGQSIVADVLNLRENDAWRKAVKDMGARYKVWLNVPLDAQLN